MCHHTLKLCYNKAMKKLLLLLLMFPCITVFANEITEDYFDIAANYALQGNYTDALNYVNKILDIEPSNIEAQKVKNTLLRVTNPTSNKILQIKTQNDLALATAYIDKKDYQNALNLLNKYISLNPNSDIAHALRAEVNLNLNNITAAENDIKKATSIEENIAYLLTEAKILYHKGEYEDARIKLSFLSRNVQTAEVYKYLGLCDYAEKDYASALLNIDKAIILSDDDKSLNSTYNEIKNMLEKNG